MTGQRRGYVIALVVAVLALLVSVGAAIGFALSPRIAAVGRQEVSASTEGWQPGPAGSMMGVQGWHGGGMMDDWNDRGTAAITPAQARTAADAWVTANQPGATVSDGIRMPMGYLFTLTQDGVGVGTIVVDDDTGQVTWWQRTTPSPSSPAS